MIIYVFDNKWELKMCIGITYFLVVVNFVLFLFSKGGRYPPFQIRIATVLGSQKWTTSTFSLFVLLNKTNVCHVIVPYVEEKLNLIGNNLLALAL